MNTKIEGMLIGLRLFAEGKKVIQSPPGSKFPEKQMNTKIEGMLIGLRLFAEGKKFIPKICIPFFFHTVNILFSAPKNEPKKVAFPV